MANGSWHRRDSGVLIFGAFLILLGIVFFVGSLFGIAWERFLWPFFIIVPGVLLFIFALATTGQAGEALSVPASIITMVGLLLLYQSITGHWESWAYAWALVAPTSIGLGQMVYGTLKRRPRLVKAGTNVAMVGGTIFVVGAVFFEMILNISNFGRNTLVWALLLIGLGVFILVRTILFRRGSA